MDTKLVAFTVQESRGLILPNVIKIRTLIFEGCCAILCQRLLHGQELLCEHGTELFEQGPELCEQGGEHCLQMLLGLQMRAPGRQVLRKVSEATDPGNAGHRPHIRRLLWHYTILV